MSDCSHEAVDIGGLHPNDLHESRSINLLLGIMKTSFVAPSLPSTLNMYPMRCLGSFCFHFNRRYQMPSNGREDRL